MLDIFQNDTFWSAVSAIFTIVASVGIYFVYIQMRFQAWVKAQDIFTDKNFIVARTKVFDCIDHPYKSCSLNDANIVCRKMDELAHIVPYLAFLGKRETLKYWGDPIAKAWCLLEKHVIIEREHTQWLSKWLAFENLGNEAIKIKPNLKRHSAKISYPPPYSKLEKKYNQYYSQCSKIMKKRFFI